MRVPPVTLVRTVAGKSHTHCRKTPLQVPLGWDLPLHITIKLDSMDTFKKFIRPGQLAPSGT